MKAGRLDDWLIQQKYVQTRQEAFAWVMAGRVFVNGQLTHSAAQAIKPTDQVLVNQKVSFVSRGGDKLAPALESFQIQIQDKVCLDTGSSTGGFTDCLLRLGAQSVWAIDVGKGLLDPHVRSNPRVKVMEERHILKVSPGELNPAPTFATIDLSFISLTHVLPHLWQLLAEPKEVLALVKPQFEVSPKDAPKGIVRSDTVLQQAIETVKQVAIETGWRIQGLIPSTVKGKKGNQEFFLWLLHS